MQKYEENIGKEVYLLGYTIQASNEVDAQTQVLTTKYLARKALKTSAAGLGEASLLHGTLTRAKSIPNVINDNVDIFLVVPHANAELDSFIIQCKDLAYLQQVVTVVIGQNAEADLEDLDELVDDIMAIELQNIEDLYILYGYEIELQFDFEDDSIDEELAEAGKKIYKSIASEQDK